jgi:hypothetical protein
MALEAGSCSTSKILWNFLSISLLDSLASTIICITLMMLPNKIADINTDFNNKSDNFFLYLLVNLSIVKFYLLVYIVEIISVVLY